MWFYSKIMIFRIVYTNGNWTAINGICAVSSHNERSYCAELGRVAIAVKLASCTAQDA